jgi:subtilisin family serine protease
VNVRKRALSVVGAVLICFVGIGSASAVFPASDPLPPAQFEQRLLDQLDAAGSLGMVEVLVGATDADAAEAAIRAVGLVPAITFDKVGFSATRGTATQVRAIAAQPGVRYLQGNYALRPQGNTATITTRVVNAEDTFTAPGGSELDGSGVGIAVVDSGMAGDHPMYQDATGKTRLLNIKQMCANFFECAAHMGDEANEYFINATGVDTDLVALGGHGTHVTGIAGGREVTASNGVVVRGVARNASLYGLGAGLGIFALNAAASLNWVLEHHADPCGAFFPRPDVAGGCAPIKVVNNSYGSPGEYNPFDIFTMLSERLVLEGVTVVWAAGNGEDITATDPRPNDGTVNLSNSEGGQSPMPGVLMVANYDDRGVATRLGQLNESSSRGERGRPETYPDLSAPGTSILSACRPYLPICHDLFVRYEDQNFGEISGTSMAAPHVAGIVALLLQAHPGLTPAQIEDVLEDSAFKFGDASTYEPDVATASAPVPNQVRNDTTTSFDKGHGLVDLAAALHRLAATADPGGGPDPCATESSSFSDPAGDATEFVFTDTHLDAISYPGLDMLTATVTPVDANNVRFTIEVDDLTDMPAPGAIGDYFRYTFTFAGRAFELDLVRELAADGTFTTDFFLFQNGLTEDVDIANGLTGAFDTAEDEVWAIVPSNAIQNVYPDSPLLSYESNLGTPQAVSQRLEGVLTATVDSAAAGCTVVLPPDPTPPTTTTTSTTSTTTTSTTSTTTTTHPSGKIKKPKR